MGTLEEPQGLPVDRTPGLWPSGRDTELEAVERFVREVPTVGGSLVLEGEAGIGKTTVWEVARQRSLALGYDVLSARPAEPESTWPYVALIDLLGPSLDDVLPHLPGPQARALSAALLRSEPEPQLDHRTVPVAVLGALRLLAEDRPVVICIDDMHWMDRESATLLTFALRRLDQASVATLATVRSGHAEPLGFAGDERSSRLVLGPLSVGAVARILRERLGATLPRPALVRIHEATGGNALYALEVTAALLRSGAAIRPGEPLPITDDLQRLLADRLKGLSASCRRLVLFVSAQPHPHMTELAGIEGVDLEASLDEAVKAGVVTEESGRLRFTHPLLGSAAYGAASPGERRSAHRSLALSSDPERRARHLALATVSPDRGVAAAVEEGARAVAGRGAPDSAAALYERACGLTPAEDVDDRRRRTILAAEHFRRAGDRGRARDLLAEPVRSWPPGHALGEALLTLARLLGGEGDSHVAADLYRRALREGGDDPALRAGGELGLSWEALVVGAWDAAVDHARSAADVVERHHVDELRGSALATLVEAVFLSGGGVDRQLVDRALAWEEAEPLRTEVLAVLPSYVCGSVLKWSGDIDGGRSLLERSRARAAEQGDEDTYAQSLYQLAELECRAGRWTTAAAHAAEGVRASPGRGQLRAAVLYASALVDAHLGRVHEAREAATEGVALAQGAGATTRSVQNLSVLGFLAVSEGDPGAAHDHLGVVTDFVRAAGVAEPGVLRFVPDEVESLIALGELDDAGQVLDWYEGLAVSTGRPWALAAVARCRGALCAAGGDLEAALAKLEEAVERHERVAEPFERARTLLALGATRRRARHKASAREALDEALATFEELGAPLWAERAGAELSRIGGRARAPDALTPTEQQVASLVAEGRANREVADAMHMTVKAVEGNLTRVYRKLGVRSRTELAANLASVAHRPSSAGGDPGP